MSTLIRLHACKFPECINITLMGNYRSFTQNVTRDTAAKAGFDKGDGRG